MTCDEARDLMLDRPPAGPELRSHLAGCADCAAVREEMGRIDAWVAPLREEPVPPALLSRRSGRPGAIARGAPLLVAAAMLIAVSLAAVVFKPAPPAPAAQDDVAPVGGLALRCSVDKERYEFKEPITLTATLENLGERNVVYFRDATSWTFPAFRIRGADREWQVYVAPYQTIRSDGLHGSLETLEPRGKVSYPLKAGAFTKGDDRATPVPLPEGEYTVVASYAKKDNKVPYNVGGFETEFRPVDGLWTGAVASTPARFRVGAPHEPVVTIEPPERGTNLRISFANVAVAPACINGRLKLSVHSKAYGGGSAEVRLADEKKLAPGELWVLPVDLAALEWTSSDPKLMGTYGIGEFAPNGGWMDLAVEMQGPESKTLMAPGRLVSWEFVPSSAEGLALGLEMKTPLEATLKLTNTGNAPTLVNKRLAYASEVAFRMTDPAGVRPAGFSTAGKAPDRLEDLLQRATLDLLGPVIVDGLSWSREALSPRTPLDKSDFISLAPGASIETGYPLARLVHGGVPKGTYRVQAVYLNVEPGVRLGLPGAWTGTLTSNTVDVVVP